MAQVARRKKSNPRKRKSAQPDEPIAVPVAAVGASAGGLEPISQFLAAMPVDAGLAVVVIQHLDPASKSILPELLARRSRLKVSLAKDGIALQPNQVYVIPPAVFLSITSGRLRISPAQTGTAARMPIDVFLHSLAADRGRRGVGIIMSGTGTDGAAGLKALREAGGLALVQDPNETQQDGMPRHAIITARPDYVLSVREMPAVLTRYINHNYVKSRRPTTAMHEAEIAGPAELAPLVEFLKSIAGLDFGHYKTGTLQRRIERRMALHGVTRWVDYLTMLHKSPAEANALAKDLLISVTGFFRDAKAFRALAKAMPDLLKNHPIDQPLRIWVVGCSTGEEAYSLGILALEQIAAAGLRRELQIFATDVDQEALRIARAGLYPESIQADVTPDRLERFFTSENGHFRVAQELRKSVIFSRHDTLHDPPFPRLDLVSCRNVLIYLVPDAQRQLLTLLHFALHEGGLLFLGAAESLGTVQTLFEPLNEKLRIYRRRGSGRTARLGVSLMERGPTLGVTGRAAPPVGPRQPSLQELVQRTMLDSYAPAAVVTNRQFSPLYFFGMTDRYLQVVAGEPSQDVLLMAREGLRAKLRETIVRAFRSKRRIATHGVWFRRDGRTAMVTIEAQRLNAGWDDLVLVSFIDALPEVRKAPRSRTGKDGDNAELDLLRQQLTEARRELNRTIHDLRGANEALKGKNEETMSLNEEFLSANEELESSKEELQSLNEELTTVNVQLRQALEQQQQTSADLSNLLNSSSVATIFLDSRLRIKIFNPRMQELFSLIDADIGRPLADLLPKFADPTLLTDAVAAQSSGAPSEREIRTEAGVWYLRSVTPYRLETRHIAGSVVTFSDVSGLKRAEIAASAAQRYAETIVDTIREPLVTLDSDLKIISANTAFKVAFDLNATDVVGRPLGALASPLLTLPELTELIAPPAVSPQPVDHVELELEQPTGGLRVWRAVVRHFQVPPSDRPMVLLSLQDVTEERRILRQQLQLLIDSLPGAFLAVDSRQRVRFVSGQTTSLFGYDAKEIIGQPVDMLIPPTLRERHARLHADFFKNPTRRPMGFELEISGLARDGTVIPLDIGLSPVPTAEGPLVIAVIQDLRPQKRGQELLQEAKVAAERANQAKSRFLAAASHDLRQPLQTIELLHGVLERRLADAETRSTLGQLDDAVAHMTELLDSLLDINRLESGEITPDVTDVSIAPVLARACDEQAPVAASKGLQLRMVPCSSVVRSDRRLLARIVSNLLTNAIKYTDHGKILVGCRRRSDTLRIEVWDTGIGIAADQVDAIFEEFYRVDRSDSSRSGLGLGLYIVQRFAQLLGHTVEVRSTPGRGTMFAVVVPFAEGATAPPPSAQQLAKAGPEPAILLVEDDPRQREALRTLLEMQGYVVIAAATGADALAQVRASTSIRPHVIVADYNLPGGMSGLEAIREVRRVMSEQLPAAVITADRTLAVRQAIEASGLTSVSKPVRSADLISTVDALVQTAKPGWQRVTRPPVRPALVAEASSEAIVAVIEDEASVREALRRALGTDGYKVATFPSAEGFFADAERRRFRCLVVDLNLPGMDGLALQNRLKQEHFNTPIIFVTGDGALSLAVKAMREGAADFLQKPVPAAALRESVNRVLANIEQAAGDRTLRDQVAVRLATLTKREKQVMERVLAGNATKNIAADLGLSERTVEHYRHSVMRKIGARSLAMLVRLVAPHVTEH